MQRRNFLKGLPMVSAISAVTPLLGFRSLEKNESSVQPSDREYWIEQLVRVTEPVLQATFDDRIKELMPVESMNPNGSRAEVTHLEALGRSLSGLAPWLELGADETKEGKLRRRLITLSTGAIKNAVTPTARSYMNFTKQSQPLVDAAFLSHALIRAPKQLWGNLDVPTRSNLVEALKSTRAIRPYNSNWLLFSAIIEAALLKFTGDYDPARIEHAISSHEQWYKGDGVYGDGPDFHFDYYNSYVIQPMMLDIVKLLHEHKVHGNDMLQRITTRAQRYAEIQERLISPEGTFPPVGRSLAYRCGAFQLLSQMSLAKQLPAKLKPAQVRCALTAVIKRTLEVPGTFDKNGWLTIGLAGHQPEIGEHYISTGSLYLCTVAFLALGLDENDEFWTSPPADWTSKSAFSGKQFSIDSAI